MLLNATFIMDGAKHQPKGNYRVGYVISNNYTERYKNVDILPRQLRY